jgi:hypothetical protein
MTELQTSVTFNSEDPASMAMALKVAFEHIQDLHHSVFALGTTIGILANASEVGVLAQPGAVQDIVRATVDYFMPIAPRAAAALLSALEVPLGGPPPNGGTHLKIVRSDEGERKAAA